MERIDFPLTGNSIIMAIVILVHVFFAFFAVGGSTLAVFSEWVGRRKGNDDYITLARKVTKFLADMMKINGVLGVAIIVLIIGLWGSFAKLLYSVMFWPFVTEGLFFLILMIFSIAYNNNWDKTSPGKHLFYGVMTAFAAIMTAFLINAIWAFMMTPGEWITTQNRWDAFFNPILWESYIHMLIPCLLNAALFIFLWSYWKLKTSDRDLEFYEKINRFTGRKAALLIFLQPISGISFLARVKSATQDLATPNPWQQVWTGLGRPYLHAMVGLAGIAIIFAILYWIFGHEKGRKFLMITALAVFVAFVMGGYTREKARKPYLVWGTMYMNQKLVGEKVEPAIIEGEISGERVYSDWECGACHTLQGKGGNIGPELVDLHESYQIEELKEFLKEPPEDMPPFEGSEEELEKLAEYVIYASGE
ncbi:MAG: cytochrome ubiquinol oxidase subunit I [Candidatus Zixiibacteriota bacterium]|nr:MAG: cytochrome ubiquinol oxidase subunit I [candidate division Zixibacteria bacterium]